MMKKGDEMTKIDKQTAVATIYNKSPKSKAELRAESEKAMKAFLRKGGSVVLEKTKRIPKPKMAAKTSRGFVAGTGGFAVGYPQRSTVS
jgi:hypothetical protein